MLQEFHPAVVAFFDLDRTLIGKSSGELYIRTLRQPLKRNCRPGGRRAFS
jgi:hypothetical protein